MPKPLPLPVDRLGLALKRWRALNAVKQSALAIEFRVSQTTISRWESGILLPDMNETGRIMQFLAGRHDGAMDSALVRLVEDASRPVHLICDYSHRLLAASRSRVAQWRVAEREMIGTSLWRFATEGIAKAETGLAPMGWYDPFPADVIVETEQADFAEVTIHQGALRYARIPLSDGGFGRLVWDEPRSGCA